MEAFAHSSIWSVTKAYLNQTRSGFGLKIVGLGLNLHKSRKKADYDEDGFEASSLCSCIKSAQAIIDGLTGGKV